jgi:hypothetical protein
MSITDKYPEFSKFTLEYLINNKTIINDLILSSEEPANMAYKLLFSDTVKRQFDVNIEQITQYLSNSDSENNNNNQMISSKPDVISFLDHLLTFFPTEASKNWTRLLAFLEFWEDLIASANELIIKYMITNECIFRFIDFFLQKESPYYKKGETRHEMGNKTVIPKFSPLISSISLLVRHCYTSTFTKDDKAEGKVPHTYIGKQVKYNLIFIL